MITPTAPVLPVFTINNFKVYFNQLQNKYNPQTSCNVTSLAMGISACEYNFPNTGYLQPPDNLYQFMLKDEKTNNYWKSLYPDGSVPINESSKVLAYASNRWLKKNFNDWRSDLTGNKILEACIQGGCVQVSIKNELTPNGHFLLITGANYRSDRTIYSWIFQDPFGNMFDGYNDKNGANLSIDNDKLFAMLQPLDNKLKIGQVMQANN